MISLDLAVNAIVSGLLLGGFYAAVTIGVTISFGMLDIVNIAHPAFIMLGSFVAYIVNSSFGIDPILIGVVTAPVFFLVGMAVYQIYYYAFERRGEKSIQGLAFFFGLLFVGEVALILVFGVDYRFVDAPYIGPSLHFGFVDLPLRMLIPCLVSLLDAGGAAGLSGAHLYRPRHPRGITGPAGTAADGGQPEPRQDDRLRHLDRHRLGGRGAPDHHPAGRAVDRPRLYRAIFAICVLGGMTSFPGMLAGAMLIGIVESVTATFYGPSWAPAVAFGFLLLTLAVRPAGILGR